MNNTTCPFCNATHRVIVPTVHLNGTSAEELRDQLQAAIEALRTAQRMLVQAAPNGRDYYPQGNSATETAMWRHACRYTDLNRMLSELEEQRDHVQAVLDYKAQHRIREVRVLADLPTAWDEGDK